VARRLTADSAVCAGVQHAVHLLDGEDTITRLPLEGPSAKATITAPAGRHYLRPEVRDQGGTTELININFPKE
jgi:hypothetical protein